MSIRPIQRPPLARLMALAMMCTALACGTDAPTPMRLDALSVSRVPVALSTPAQLSGEHFYVAVSVDLNADEVALGSQFRVFVGSVELAAQRIDAQTLELVLPAGLPEGEHDLRVIAPSGDEDILEDALLVAEPLLRIEDAGDGSGNLVEMTQLAIGSSIELFSLSRWPDGLLFRSEVVDWTATGMGGSVEATSTSLLVMASGLDTWSVVAKSEPFGDATAEIQTAECFGPADCSVDPTLCRSATCEAGLCGLGPVDKDSDGDGFIDAACDGGDDCDDDPAACGAACFPGNAAGDLCDALNNDCDGATDEDHVASATSCGVGACAGNAGSLTCVAGVETDSCDPLAGAAADDATCDNVNDDCDGATDEDYALTGTTCGVGACAGNTGVTSCSVGIESDDCDSLAGAAADDTTCNNVNDDCDGATDEDYAATATSCGVGACAGNTGVTSCSVGIESDDCDPLAGAAADDTTCNNVNDDCDGATDEDYAVTATTCGIGACAGNSGTLTCVTGVESDSCDPLAGAAADDATCDNVNDDCDAATDEDFATTLTSCGVGACAGNTGNLTCTAGVQNDDCDPVSGASAENLATAGTCIDTIDNDCDGDTDIADLTCQGGNTPPVAAIVISPAAGDTSTLFSGDGSTSFDLEEATASLTYDWDWDGDSFFEATGISSTHSFATPGSHVVSLRVRDGAGVDDFTTFIVVVSDPSDLITVTTAADESDAGATPASPGGTGLSLREAIAFADLTAGRQTVFTPSGASIVLGSPLVPTDSAGVDLVGDGVALDGVTLGFDCIVFNTSNNQVFGFDMQRCQSGVSLAGNGNLASRLSIHDCSRGIDMAGDNNQAGPGVEVFNHNLAGFDVRGVGNTVRRTFAHDNLKGVEVFNNAASFTLVESDIVANGQGVTSRGDDGVYRHNTFHGNTTAGLNFTAQSTGNEFVNNLLTTNAAGITASDASFVELDFSNFFGNAGGDCSSCTPGVNSLFVDPDYINSGSGDYRLLSSSPVIDQGTDTGLDLNGPGPGNFAGVAPDIGAHETP